MQTKDEIIKYACGKKYKQICFRIAKEQSLADDLFQEFILCLLEKDESCFAEIKTIDAYLFRIIKNTANKSFFAKYNRKVTKEDIRNYNDVNSNGFDKRNKKFTAAFESLYWYDREVLRMYAEEGTTLGITRKVNIPNISLWRTVKKARIQIKKRMAQLPIKTLLPVQYNVTGLDYHRLLMPFERLLSTTADSHDVKMIRGIKEGDKTFEPPLESMTEEEYKQFDVVYVLRQISHDISKIQPTIDKIKTAGCKIVFDIDDYWKLPKEHYWHSKYKEQKVEDGVIATLEQADAVVTTTETFKNIISAYNKNVTILPNCINPDDKQFTSVSIASGRMRFGWIGGVFHRPDIAILKNSLQFLYKTPELKDRWQICFGGFNPNPEFLEIEKTLTADYCFRSYDKGYYDYLSQLTQLMEHVAFNKPYRRLWGKDVRNYGTLYNDVDVCLVPLLDNTFNNCKSELKIVEAGAMGKAVICSDVAPYNKWIQDGVNGLLIPHSQNHMGWFAAIRKLVLNPDMAKSMAAELQKTIKENFDIDVHNKKRDELLKSLVL